MFTLYVGVDVSKDTFSCTGLHNKAEKRFCLTASMNRTGFADLLETIRNHCSETSSVLVGMESTGCYHVNLYSFLAAHDIKTVVINPLLINNFAKLSLRKTKTDKKDSLLIAQFLVLNTTAISAVSVSEDHRDLRELARERESISHLIAKTKTEIRQALHRTFPELPSLCNVFSRGMLEFLKAFPSARMIRLAKPKAISKALRPADKRKTPPVSAEQIMEAARSSVASISLAKELIVPGKIATLLHLQQRLTEMTELLENICKATMVQDLEVLTSIKGISTKTAIPFLAELSAIERFDSYKKLIAYAGLDPAIYNSGKRQASGKISKRGNSHLRRVIWLMTFCTVRQNPVMKDYFLKRIREGLPFKKAMMATSHKLLRLIYAMLTRKTYYVPQISNA